MDEPLPLYEGKIVGQFNHRTASILINRSNVSRQAQSEVTPAIQLSDATYEVSPQYWVRSEAVRKKLTDKWQRKWLLHFCAVTSPTNERTCISCVTPLAGAGHSLFQVYPDAPIGASTCLVGNLNSYIFDFVLREKMGGINLSHFIFQQLPIVDCDAYDLHACWDRKSLLRTWTNSHVLELTYTAWDLDAFALDCGYDGPPFRWDEERRFQIRCELDAAYFHLYLGSDEEWAADTPMLREVFPTPRDAADYIMDTFPIVRRKDIARTQVKNAAGEVASEGTYITKDAILKIYDAMAEAIRTGQPYQTRLDPPPGPPTDAEGNFIPVANWDKSNWPAHIHRARAGQPAHGGDE